MSTFVFAVYQDGDGLQQEVVEATDELRATQIFVSDHDYMSWQDAQTFDYADQILDEVYDTQEVTISYIELE
jgi:hypothetical protein